MKKALQLKEFREQLELTQLEMAKFLGTTRSQIAMVEKGGRTLPIDNIVRLATLHRCAVQTSELGTAVTMKVAEGVNQLRARQAKDWESRRLKLEYDRLRFTKQLETMRETWDTCFQLAATMYQLQKVMDDTEPADFYTLYATERLNYACRNLVSCGETAQQDLQLQIDTCDAELTLINKLISGK